MISKKKKYSIMTLELPFILLGICVKIVIASLTFIYLRWVRKGIYWGLKAHNALETHELGHKRVE